MDAFYTRMYIRLLPVNLDIRQPQGRGLSHVAEVNDRFGQAGMTLVLASRVQGDPMSMPHVAKPSTPASATAASADFDNRPSLHIRNTLPVGRCRSAGHCGLLNGFTLRPDHVCWFGRRLCMRRYQHQFNNLSATSTAHCRNSSVSVF
jgi:hypothetical protein